MSGSPLGPGLLALLLIGSQAAFVTTTRNGNDNGCNGVPHGIPCCEDGFTVGDNEGGDHGRGGEIFIQAYNYITSCSHTCKVLHEESVGITESVRQKYSSGQGKNKNKCWCEFGEHKLNSDNQEYRTCLFKSMSKESLPSDVAISSKAHETPEFYLVYSKGEADSTQSEKMGLYRKWGSTEKNNFPVWKNEKKEQYLFMSDNHHWGIGPDYNNDLFGLLNYEDKLSPALPHLGNNWMFWAGQEWRKDTSTHGIQVLEGDTEDAGVDREILFVDHSPLIIENVDDASHCCQACKEQADPDRKNWDDEFYNTKVFNYDNGAKTCDCMNLRDSGLNGPAIAVFTRYNPLVTSGLCDTRAKFELERRTGRSGRIHTTGLGTMSYYNKDTYNYTDVQGPLGEGRMFYQGNLLHEHSVKPEGPMDHDSCCRECQKMNPNIQLEYHNAFGNCHCQQVKPGTRPVTIPAHFQDEFGRVILQDKTSFAGICNTTTFFDHRELIGKFSADADPMMVWKIINIKAPNSTATLPPH